MTFDVKLAIGKGKPKYISLPNGKMVLFLIRLKNLKKKNYNAILTFALLLPPKLTVVFILHLVNPCNY